jgi:hypothetical protein
LFGCPAAEIEGRDRCSGRTTGHCWTGRFPFISARFGLLQGSFVTP